MNTNIRTNPTDQHEPQTDPPKLAVIANYLSL